MSASERDLLMIPGPSQVDPSVMRAMMKTTESHMSEPFGLRYRSVLDKLKEIFAAEGEAFALAGSGTLAQEIALANMVQPGDKVLNLVTGFFSGRFVYIAKALGCEAYPLNVAWGKAIKPEDVQQRLASASYKAVTCAHVETSTGVAIPLREIGQVVKASGASFVVDTVASLAGMEVKTDEWGIDANCTCSQKCVGVPPGLAMIGLSKEGLRKVEERKEPVPTVYGDLRGWLTLARNPAKGYYATQPVNLIYALDAALDLVLAEGLDARFRRHKTIAEACRSAMTAMGLRLAAEKGYAADTVTSVYYPKGIEDTAFRAEVSRNHVSIARGFGELEGQIFRIGHMGNVNSNDIVATVSAIERSLKKFGHLFEFGAGCKAAMEALEGSP